MLSIFVEISVRFQAFELKFATMERMLHLNMLTGRVFTVKRFSVVDPLKMWEADLFQFKHVSLHKLILKSQIYKFYNAWKDSPLAISNEFQLSMAFSSSYSVGTWH